MSSKPLTLKPKKLVETSRLPLFPKFVPLETEHQAILVNAVKAVYPYSDFNFISMWSWDHENKLKLCTLNGNLVVRFQDYEDPTEFFYSFFGTRLVDQTAVKLLKHSGQEGKNELKLMPEFVVNKLRQRRHFVIKEDRDNFDYIVAIKEMVELKNGKNEKKRWSMNQFMRDHEQHLTVRELDIKNKEASKQMLTLIDVWQKQKDMPNSPHDDHDLKAIHKMLREHPAIETEKLHIVGLYLEDELKAFSITELLEDGFAMGHYKKIDRNYRGLGVALDHYTAKGLQAKGASLLNHEQDLGIEGLRQAKLASHPIYFLKKYTIGLKTTADSSLRTKVQ